MQTHVKRFVIEGEIRIKMCLNNSMQSLDGVSKPFANKAVLDGFNRAKVYALVDEKAMTNIALFFPNLTFFIHHIFIDDSGEFMNVPNERARPFFFEEVSESKEI